MVWASTFGELFDFERRGDQFTARSAQYPWGQVYGGQVAAQGLLAAGLTATEDVVPHSLHASFVRTGMEDEPIVYDVERVRDGRSFVTRQVVARQSHGIILNLLASFQRPEDEPVAQMLARPVDVVGPGELPTDSWTTMLERSRARVEGDTAQSWIRVVSDYPSTPLMQAVAHTYTSDDVPTEAVEFAHPLGRFDYSQPDAVRPYMGASLDHAIWFHDLRSARDWTLHNIHSRGVRGGRGLAIGELWTEDGVQVATVVQEVLLRVARSR